ncbi:9279_t:CDS:2 [Ambispora leptoticha]|uniref:9279_t:CDS:1 n=1 Tax=Ambispora leptoticha TaxID=144679 RepID=A0A9N8YP55_9GLOM|nr:9279_t:CDS:2 [Ambispora leptoticha]
MSSEAKNTVETTLISKNSNNKSKLSYASTSDYSNKKPESSDQPKLDNDKTHPSSPPSSSSYHENEAARVARIRKVFDELDKNGTGFLDREKIQKGLSELKNLPARNKYASELLQRCDTSKDGLVDFQEFKTFVEEKEKELWKLFVEIDKSRDMALQPEELEGALWKAGIHCTKQELKNFIHTMDKDGNGVIDFGEWRDFLLLLPSETTLHEIYYFYRSVAQINIDGEAVIPVTNPKYFVAGALAGAVSRTATAPFDRLKIFLQTQTVAPSLKLSATKTLQKQQHGGVIDNKNVAAPVARQSTSGLSNVTNAIKELYRQGGILNFFRGNGLNVAKIAPENSIKFYSYEQSKAIISYSTGQSVESIGMSGRFLAGGIAGLLSQFSIYPLEALKTRVMSSAGVSSSTGSRNVGNNSLLLRTAKEMWQIQGPRTFYRGLTPALIGVFPYSAIDMSVYENLKMAYMKWDEARCGMISGSVGATAVYPLSLVRTRLQAQGTLGHPQKYVNAFDVIQKTYACEGIRGFYKGLMPTLIKVVPAAAIFYVAYEQAKSKLKLP